METRIYRNFQTKPKLVAAIPAPPASTPVQGMIAPASTTAASTPNPALSSPSTTATSHPRAVAVAKPPTGEACHPQTPSTEEMTTEIPVRRCSRPGNRPGQPTADWRYFKE